MFRFIFNSEVFDKICQKFYAGGILGEKGFRYKVRYLSDVPIPKPSSNQKNEIEGMYEILNNIGNQNYEQAKITKDRLNKTTLNLYKLSEDEADVLLNG